MHLHHVADREHLGVGGQGQVGADRDPAGPVELGAGLGSERGGELGGDDAGGPDDGPRRHALALPRRDRDRFRVDADDLPPDER